MLLRNTQRASVKVLEAHALEYSFAPCKTYRFYYRRSDNTRKILILARAMAKDRKFAREKSFLQICSKCSVQIRVVVSARENPFRRNDYLYRQLLAINRRWMHRIRFLPRGYARISIFECQSVKARAMKASVRELLERIISAYIGGTIPPASLRPPVSVVR